MKSQKKHYWTPEERRFLKEQAAKRLPWKIIAENFNRHFSLNLSLFGISRFASWSGIRTGIRIGSTLPVGSERIDRGVLMVKTHHPDRWRPKHRVIYETTHGIKLKKNDIIIFADGNHANLDVDNLIKVSRAELIYMNFNGLLSDNADVTKVGKSIASIKILIAKRKRQLKHRSKNET